jgi:hypothetical protein
MWMSPPAAMMATSSQVLTKKLCPVSRPPMDEGFIARAAELLGKTRPPLAIGSFGCASGWAIRSW